MRAGAAAGLCLWSVAATPAGPTAPAAAPAPAALEILARYQCARCHDGTGLPTPPIEQSCTGCHRKITDGTFSAAPDLLGRWNRNIVGLRQAPSLAGIGRRLRRDWVRAFLLRPVDVRPALAATMPWLALTEREAVELARQLVRDDAAAATEGAGIGDVAAGRRSYARLRCATCHAFTGAKVDVDVGVAPSRPGIVARGDGERAPPDAVALAPDLALARARLQPGRLADWIRDPQSASPGSLMPTPGIGAAEAQDLAAFILRTPLRALGETSRVSEAGLPRTARLPAVPDLRRPIRFAEVAERVFQRTCRHCHSSPDYALGDGGPGNSGGFGFPARGLDLSSYAGIASGALDSAGHRRSIFRPLDDGTPALIAHLRARQAEEAGVFDPNVRGMPLGFPAVTSADLQLVEDWVAQGRPR